MTTDLYSIPAANAANPPDTTIPRTTTVNETAVLSNALNGNGNINGNSNDSIKLAGTTNNTDTYTSDEEESLFLPSLISPEIQSVLPEGYSARPLRRSDYHLRYLDVLRVLTTVGDITEAMWNERYDYLLRRNDEYYLIVICDGSGRIVGTGSLIVERKFIHTLGLVGHIEDIAVSQDQQGKKLGLRIIQTLDYVAAKVGCYKVSHLSLTCIVKLVHSADFFFLHNRLSSIAQKSMKAFISSVASSAPASKWRTITELVSVCLAISDLSVCMNKFLHVDLRGALGCKNRKTDSCIGRYCLSIYYYSELAFSYQLPR
jgi:glucosamine-phosphate N-acetyltransferase